MKQELQDQLVGILSSISNTVGQAKDFALAQLPDIAQSYVLYGRISLTLYVVLSLVVLAASIYGVKPIVKAVEEDNPALGIPLIIGCLVGGVVGIFTFFFDTFSCPTGVVCTKGLVAERNC